MASYTVFDNGETHHGDARSILEEIRIRAARNNEEIAAVDVDGYASILIEDAPYFVDDDLYRAMQNQSFDSKFDKALTFLTQMPTSGVRILTVRAA